MNDLEGFFRHMASKHGEKHDMRNNDAFCRLMDRLTKSIDKHKYFERINDVENESDQKHEIIHAIESQITAQTEHNEWEKSDGSSLKEVGRVIKIRSHIMHQDSFVPVLSYFLSFSHVTEGEAGMRDSIALWDVTIHIRDKRIEEKYGKLLHFAGNIFNEDNFVKLLKTFDDVLEEVAELDDLNKEDELNEAIQGNALNLAALSEEKRIKIIAMLHDVLGDDFKLGDQPISLEKFPVEQQLKVHFAIREILNE